MYAVPQRQITEVFGLPAPLKGMRATDSLMDMQPDECIFAYNILPTEYGMKTRLGSSEHSRIAAGTDVWSIIPYSDPEVGANMDRLFSVTSEGIYDSTNRSTTPTNKLTFTTKTGNAGYGFYTHYTNDNGTPFVYFTDAENGLFEYDPAADTWAAVSGALTFPGGDTRTEVDLVFVCSHKLRLWFIPKNANHAYYLPVASKSGNLTKFNFGNKFKHGGSLVGLYTWSLDGGDGPDDYLIAVSSGGDAIMYRGEDPSSAATWTVVGSWYIGPTPAGRRIACEFGGDLMFLTALGIISANQLVRGITAEIQSQAASQIGVLKILKERMKDSEDFEEYGWELAYNAVEGELIVLSPQIGSNPNIQYVKNLATKGWGIWRDLDIKSFGIYKNRIFFGDSAKVLWEMIEGRDGILIDDADAGVEVDFSLLTSYSEIGRPGNMKHVTLVHPYFLSTQPVSYLTQVLYDFDIQEIAVQGSIIGYTGSLWDTAIWGTNVWGGVTTPYGELGGQAGIGRKIAIAIRGLALKRLTLVYFDVYIMTGGLL